MLVSCLIGTKKHADDGFGFIKKLLKLTSISGFKNRIITKQKKMHQQRNSRITSEKNQNQKRTLYATVVGNSYKDEVEINYFQMPFLSP